MSERKAKCPVCGWQGSVADMLKATKPFEIAETITGCPSCKSVIDGVVLCDEPGCWLEASCGAPTLAGYRVTCKGHTL